MHEGKQVVHVAGVAGVGMSSLAEAMIHQGYIVTGSDRFMDQGRSLGILQCLEKMGVVLFPQDGSGITDETDILAVSTAIEPANPDLLAAHHQGVAVLHRSKMLARLVHEHPLVAIAGTSGKTTVTALTGWLMAECGLDPFVINGGQIIGWDTPDSSGSVYPGRKGPWVIEADESDKSFLNYFPDWALINNISRDHFDWDETVALFRQFCTCVRTGLVLGPNVKKQLGVEKIPDHLEIVDLDNASSNGTLSDSCPLPGEHNRQNALAALALCKIYGVSDESLRRALRSFRGVRRRLEVAAEKDGITVIDDYAHNPEKITASWRAAASLGNRVLAVWRPHGFTPLYAMRDELKAAFRAVMRSQDELFLLPVFYAGGSTQAKLTSDDFCAQLRQLGVSVTYVPDYTALRKQMHAIHRVDDVILCMGARDPDLPAFAHSYFQDNSPKKKA
ncbi:MAG: hypothetical protein EOL87_06985 [Spartobacteria bacterium]|nr:hypothetical protein [Spartobacteria bacterium]